MIHFRKDKGKKSKRLQKQGKYKTHHFTLGTSAWGKAKRNPSMVSQDTEYAMCVGSGIIILINLVLRVTGYHTAN